MRKTFKSALSMLLSAAMVLTAGGVGSLVNDKAVKAEETAATAYSTDAFIMYCDGSWGNGNWDAAKASTKITGDGSYELTLAAEDVGATAEVAGAQVFCVDFKQLSAHVTDPSKLAVDNFKIQLDDADITVDASKLIKGDIEENGNYRIEIYNPGGGGATASDSPIDVDAFKWSKSIKISFDISGIEWNADTFSAGFIMYCDSSWGNGNWDGAKASTVVSGDGSYEMELTAEDVGATAEVAGAQVFCVDFPNLSANVKDASAIKVSNFKIKLDDTDITVDESKLVTGDIEENGNYRIEIYNPGGGGATASNSPIDADAFKWSKSIKISFTLEGITWKSPNETTAPADPTVAPEVTPDPGFNAPVEKAQEYHAYIGFQVGTHWLCRDPWFADQSDAAKAKWVNGNGLNVTKIATDAGEFDYDFTKQYYKTGSGSEPFANAGTYDAVFEDVTITENDKEYSVKMSGTDFSTATDGFNMLYISTDIATTQKDVKFSDATIIVDGKEIGTAKLINKSDSAETYGYYQMMVINTYGTLKEGTKVTMKDIEGMVMPTDSLELKFSVSGIDFESEQTVVKPEVYGPAVGSTFTSGNFKYKVTTETIKTGDEITTAGKVAVVGLTAKGKKAKSLVVPATVKETATYKVTAINANAFKGAKAASVTLGKNVKKIKKGAFANCKKLATLTVNAKLSSVAKDAFKGCTKTIKVKGTAVKDNVKKLTKSGYKKFK